MVAIRFLSSVLFAVVLLLGASAGKAQAAEAIEGYLSASFGMTSAAVLESFRRDGVKHLDTTDEDGDLVIRGFYDKGGIERTLVYVFPRRGDRLALVVEMYANASFMGFAEHDLSGRLGGFLSEEATNVIVASGGLPEGVERLRVWTGEGGEAGRMARLMLFKDYVAVEYIDLGLFNG